jgi:colanic acid biosynthesis glycosyl transferase WcaI
MKFKESLGLTDEFLIVHSGNMGVKQGLEVILSAAQLSREDKSLYFLLVGDGAVREKLKTKAKEMELNNLRFVSLLPDEQFREMLAATDVSLITQQNCVADIVFPSKVITLMASGRAIVAAVNAGSEVARVLKEAKAGLVVPAGDPAGLFNAISALRANDSIRHEMAHNAREFARLNWNKDVILAGMESQLFAIIAKGGVKGSHRRQIWKLARSIQKRVTVSMRNEAGESASAVPEVRE